MAVSVITDSTAYLPAEIINRYNIKVVPLNVHLPDQVFKESQGLSNTQYYNLLRNNKLFPTTSQPSAGEFFEIFNGLSPGEEAVAILISSHLSGTVQSALIARDMLAEGQEAITIIDSLSTSMGLGFQVIKACEGLAQGKTVSQIHREVLAVGQRMRLLLWSIILNTW
jgi:DegV family protein with EDD domain